LVVNDDGITSKGIRSLVEAVLPFGRVTVVAPDSPQSGMGHAITLEYPLRLKPVSQFADLAVDGYACSGTPVDCVKLATGVVLPHKPDLVVSGINHGANTAISVFYSGTMSAAVEGAIEGIPSVGFSLDSFDEDSDFRAAQVVVQTVVRNLIERGLAAHTALNVNIPKGGPEALRGIKVCRQAGGRFVEEFEARNDAWGRPYYWQSGRFDLTDNGLDTDIHALRHGYASVVPVEIDATAHHVLGDLNQWAW
jgi:5'-nucleotidase